jgi:hypothetical protein
MIKNNVQTKTNEINKNMISLNKIIQNDKKINTDLKNKIRSVYGKNYSTSELIDDYNKMYDIEYLRNWALFLNIIVVCSVVSFVFKHKSQ